MRATSRARTGSTTDAGFRLKDYPAGDTAHLDDEDKPRAQEALEIGRNALAELQDMLYAQDKWAVLLVFQAMDAAGKDGAIKHVMSGVNPQGCQVFSFKAPTSEELDHDYLWRCMKNVPERGRIGIFNRSYYEEVLVVKVHPEFLARPEAAAAGRRKEHLEGTLPGHPRVRALPVAQRRAHPQVLPERVARRAEEALPRAHRRAREELEILRRRT